MARQPNKTIAAAAGSAASAKAEPSLARQIEQAMVAATEQCVEEGISDPDVIRERKLAAREAAKAEARAN